MPPLATQGSLNVPTKEYVGVFLSRRGLALLGSCMLIIFSNSKHGDPCCTVLF